MDTAPTPTTTTTTTTTAAATAAASHALSAADIADPASATVSVAASADASAVAAHTHPAAATVAVQPPPPPPTLHALRQFDWETVTHRVAGAIALELAREREELARPVRMPPAPTSHTTSAAKSILGAKTAAPEAPPGARTASGGYTETKGDVEDTAVAEAGAGAHTRASDAADDGGSPGGTLSHTRSAGGIPGTVAEGAAPASDTDDPLPAEFARALLLACNVEPPQQSSHFHEEDANAAVGSLTNAEYCSIKLRFPKFHICGVDRKRVYGYLLGAVVPPVPSAWGPEKDAEEYATLATLDLVDWRNTVVACGRCTATEPSYICREARGEIVAWSPTNNPCAGTAASAAAAALHVTPTTLTPHPSISFWICAAPMIQFSPIMVSDGELLAISWRACGTLVVYNWCNLSDGCRIRGLPGHAESLTCIRNAWHAFLESATPRRAAMGRVISAARSFRQAHGLAELDQALLQRAIDEVYSAYTSVREVLRVPIAECAVSASDAALLSAPLTEPPHRSPAEFEPQLLLLAGGALLAVSATDPAGVCIITFESRSRLDMVLGKRLVQRSAVLVAPAVEHGAGAVSCMSYDTLAQRVYVGTEAGVIWCFVLSAPSTTYHMVTRLEQRAAFVALTASHGDLFAATSSYVLYVRGHVWNAATTTASGASSHAGSAVLACWPDPVESFESYWSNIVGVTSLTWAATGMAICTCANGAVLFIAFDAATRRVRLFHQNMAWQRDLSVAALTSTFTTQQRAAVTLAGMDGISNNAAVLVYHSADAGSTTLAPGAHCRGTRHLHMQNTTGADACGPARWHTFCFVAHPGVVFTMWFSVERTALDGFTLFGVAE